MNGVQSEVRRVVLGHPSGNQFFIHLARALDGAGQLASVATCIDWRLAGACGRLIPRSLSDELGRRSFSGAIGRPVARHPWREASRLLAGRLGLVRLVRHETGFFSVDSVYRDFDRWTARRLHRIAGAGIAYAYEDAAEATFIEAKRLGWARAYDLPIAYWETSRRLLEEEAARLPGWEPTLGGTRDSMEKLERKSRELALADLVVCPSRFVADSLPKWAHEGKRVVVAPFGSPVPGEISPSAGRSPRSP